MTTETKRDLMRLTKDELARRCLTADKALTEAYAEMETQRIRLGELYEQRDTAHDDSHRDRVLLLALMSHLEDKHRHCRDSSQAPGHSHSVPGFWDWDNGDRANQPCGFCATWQRVCERRDEIRQSRKESPRA